MTAFFPLIVRWLGWLVVVSLESVVGFPWLSVWLASEWLLALDRERAIASVVFVSLVVAALYALPLLAPCAVLVGVWQLTARTRPHSWQRFAVLLGSALLLGLMARTPLNTLTLGATAATGIIAFLFSGKKIQWRSWRKTLRTQ